ncbi:hypothetical protein PG993_010574 [Apiospora rasikravindrae]|uniref:Uncharacterized protein n=1 Tax=Apiospora rasikravindrae TaxID=990691 RepID=A0ABR1SMQ9_9PEZI
MYVKAVFMAALSLVGTSLAAPTPAPSQEVAVEKRFNGGWCGVHVHIQRGWKSYEANVKVFDANQGLVVERDIKAKGNTISGGVGGNGLPNELQVNVVNGHDSPASFVYGDQHWDSGSEGSKNDRCGVGKWDHKAHWPNKNTVDLDCGFSC